MSDLSTSTIKVGDVFEIDHPVYKDYKGKQYVVSGIRETSTGKVIKYSDGEIHERLCKFNS